MRWISALVGAGVSETVGGNPGQGGSIADSATRNNWGAKEHRTLMDKLKENFTNEQIDALIKASDKTDWKDQTNDGRHSMPPSEAYYKYARQMLGLEPMFIEDGKEFYVPENERWSKEQATQYIQEKEQISLKAAKQDFEQNMSKAVALYNAGDEKKAMEYLGYALHTTQDLYSHWIRGENGGWSSHVANFFGEKSPDNPNNNDNKYNEQNVSIFGKAGEATLDVGKIFWDGVKNGQVNQSSIDKIFDKQ